MLVPAVGTTHFARPPEKSSASSSRPSAEVTRTLSNFADSRFAPFHSRNPTLPAGYVASV